MFLGFAVGLGQEVALHEGAGGLRAVCGNTLSAELGSRSADKTKAVDQRMSDAAKVSRQKIGEPITKYSDR